MPTCATPQPNRLLTVSARTTNSPSRAQIWVCAIRVELCASRYMTPVHEQHNARGCGRRPITDEQAPHRGGSAAIRLQHKATLLHRVVRTGGDSAIVVPLPRTGRSAHGSSQRFDPVRVKREQPRTGFLVNDCTCGRWLGPKAAEQMLLHRDGALTRYVWAQLLQLGRVKRPARSPWFLLSRVVSHYTRAA